jgi:predicted dehydrogenase
VENYGGAVLKCAGSHLIDLVLYLLGRPAHLYAHIDFVEGTDFDRKVAALLEYPDGLTVGFEAAAHPLNKIGYERNSWEEWLEISGTDGRLRLCTPMWDAPDKNPALLFHYDNRNDTSVEYRFDAVNPFDREMRYFFECLKSRRQGRPNVLDGFNVDVLIDAMGQSARQERRIRVDYRDL